MDAWNLLTDTTIKAILLITQYKRINLEGKDAEIASSLKSVVKERIPTIQEEWEDAVESHLGNAWLKELMNAQAIELVILTLKDMDLMS